MAPSKIQVPISGPNLLFCVVVVDYSTQGDT